MILLLLNNEETLETLKTLEYVERDSSDTFNAKYLKVFTVSRLYSFMPNDELDNAVTPYTLVHLDILKAIALISVDIQTVFVASLLNSCSPLTSSIEGGHYE